ncbi:tetratricopeptide-like helical domain-containing protein [Artemisia annua]|uniref:Tetratricopeptide-like helical domain-containing protein n=1 Tax=Artemisia annua TaxID=35608 RepID=A0A2U1LCL8_ARTAN|nr:tetratricopeptide-like helical domain-containing protein [Artemisia annua]
MGTIKELLGKLTMPAIEPKQDFQGAEEYYSRAILVDPNDGEILSQYAKLLWELHHDEDRATSYFERAVQVASENRLAIGSNKGFKLVGSMKWATMLFSV